METPRKRGRRATALGSSSPNVEPPGSPAAEVTVSSKKKQKCGGGVSWAKKLKKDITIDTEEELPLSELVTDLEKPPEFFVKLMKGPDAEPARGPYELGEIVVPKVHGLIVVKGPNARGEKVRAVHGVRPGNVTSLTLVADYITTRNDGQATSDEDRDSARKSVVAHTTRAAPPGATIDPYADRLVWPENAPRTTGSRKATEANNAMVKVNGKMVKKASVKSNSCSHDGYACTSAEVGKCVCGEDHSHVKNASVGANSCNVDGCSCTESGEACSCDGHVHVKNASVGGAVQSGEQEKPNPNPRGPGGAGVKEFDYRPHRRSIGFHYRGYKENDKLVMSDNTFEFFEYSIGNMENGAWILGTHHFSSQGKRLSSDPYRKDGTRVQTEAKVMRNDGYLKNKARDHGKEQG
ncbi:hypothetical protein Esi_0276_0021 [Ectocarpus siliculosus]|uniref:Uncharacterized protein n=1 Tax=Ectocarpus siliculosus TaxID=2880 RepID=D7FUP9_ECTSI|nr:hypothetical protein Esi_0276_0021 [Ectocarpus siliculosus]|eukprot:CBJ31705.1 hypothetical protein Esi_0276_0021 [Ectocarpus siliculosus]